MEPKTTKAKETTRAKDIKNSPENSSKERTTTRTPHHALPAGAGQGVADPYAILKAPLSTEKSIRQIEFNNKLVFVVSPQATKAEVRDAVEQLFKVKVAKVNVHTTRGQKRAYVKLGAGSVASDISADLGLI